MAYSRLQYFWFVRFSAATRNTDTRTMDFSGCVLERIVTDDPGEIEGRLGSVMVKPISLAIVMVSLVPVMPGAHAVGSLPEEGGSGLIRSLVLQDFSRGKHCTQTDIVISQFSTNLIRKNEVTSFPLCCTVRITETRQSLPQHGRTAQISLSYLRHPHSLAVEREISYNEM